ncbi:alpha-ketoglutarate-dependent dioxygenase AlkB [Frankia sp. Cppng1_Ct_nod]|uniref:alpha-ketoglutarate-dependent dioxygenase AlkB n=1 Tax=Frankia sp. Cppng1_Ct_nod TaxID=2897162 RepID=UPI001041512B|nr:alpha-ketoglutarate-dependent dioxygenase AlkB [Frankia sp. Cppng1_Ct_nod]
MSLQYSLLISGEVEINSDPPSNRIHLDDTTWVDVTPGWLRGADELCEILAAQVSWRRGRRWMYERMVDDPRLSRWYAVSEPLPHPVLGSARGALHTRYQVPFGPVGLNFYRDGDDSLAFHRDRELRRLDDTLVAIVTLGARRPFRFRPRGGGASRTLFPASGDLLVMGGRCQADWEHAVPKVTACGPRISASWRWVNS